MLTIFGHSLGLFFQRESAHTSLLYKLLCTLAQSFFSFYFLNKLFFKNFRAAGWFKFRHPAQQRGLLPKSSSSLYFKRNHLEQHVVYIRIDPVLGLIKDRFLWKQILFKGFQQGRLFEFQIWRAKSDLALQLLF